MATVKVTSTLEGLARDMRTIAVETKPKLTKVVSKNVREGRSLARSFARKASGPHGSSYFKRITSEMTGPLTGEYGPTGEVVANAVGAGWRHGGGNRDLPKSADIQGPKFAKDVGEVADGLFWP